MSAGDPLRALANDFARAAREAPAAANEVIHHAGEHLESSMGFGADPVVANYSQGQVLFTGTDQTGLSQETTGSRSLLDVDIDGEADSLAGGLLDEGVRLIVRGR